MTHLVPPVVGCLHTRLVLWYRRQGGGGGAYDPRHPAHEGRQHERGALLPLPQHQPLVGGTLWLWVWVL